MTHLEPHFHTNVGRDIMADIIAAQVTETVAISIGESGFINIGPFWGSRPLTQEQAEVNDGYIPGEIREYRVINHGEGFLTHVHLVRIGDNVGSYAVDQSADGKFKHGTRGEHRPATPEAIEARKLYDEWVDTDDDDIGPPYAEQVFDHCDFLPDGTHAHCGFSYDSVFTPRSNEAWATARMMIAGYK